MNKIRAEDIGQLELLEPERQVGRHGACSTEYREGREAVMPESGLVVDLANHNEECTLHDGG